MRVSWQKSGLEKQSRCSGRGCGKFQAESVEEVGMAEEFGVVDVVEEVWR
jgi:hypothetical protein